MSDDCETFENILSEVAATGSQLGPTISLAEIRQALESLVETGMAKAYRLSTDKPAEDVQGAFTEDAEDVYFLATEYGKVHLKRLESLSAL